MGALCILFINTPLYTPYYSAPSLYPAEGTYGIVFRARHKSSGKIYALKKLKMEHCPDGFPQTSVREVNVLLSLHHPNIVNVAEVGGGAGDMGGMPIWLVVWC